MNVENIEAFVYAVHLGSFVKTAEALYLTQPSVTARIHSLESDLNVKLFHRSGKTISLSEQGKLFLPYAENILHSYQEAKCKLQQPLASPDDVKIGCASSISNYILPEILPAFKRAFPKVNIKIITGHSNDILEKLLQKKVDFGLVRTVTHGEIESLLFCHDPIGLFAPLHHPLLQKSQVTIEEISELPLIFFDYGSVDWLMIYNLFASKNLQPNIVLEVDSMEAAKNLVINGMGISFLPQHCVQSELKAGKLFRVPLISSTQLDVKIDIIYRKNEQRPTFIDFFMLNNIVRMS
ncbi:LysR family transcriptional regulator [Bacillus rubiinfantis]|uniref:LysR family transcriptional regulator n=1 Tax=Bacillus rubiinfantis TaxID=1499680 RepID=UPI0005AAD2C6|nr:LysR family transcriptional regulator [Bacillus rubiinfantis]